MKLIKFPLLGEEIKKQLPPETLPGSESVGFGCLDVSALPELCQIYRDSRWLHLLGK